MSLGGIPLHAACAQKLWLTANPADVSRPPCHHLCNCSWLRTSAAPVRARRSHSMQPGSRSEIFLLQATHLQLKTHLRTCPKIRVISTMALLRLCRGEQTATTLRTLPGCQLDRLRSSSVHPLLFASPVARIIFIFIRRPTGAKPAGRGTPSSRAPAGPHTPPAGASHSPIFSEGRLAYVCYFTSNLTRS